MTSLQAPQQGCLYGTCALYMMLPWLDVGMQERMRGSRRVRKRSRSRAQSLPCLHYAFAHAWDLVCFCALLGWWRLMRSWVVAWRACRPGCEGPVVFKTFNC